MTLVTLANTGLASNDHDELIIQTPGSLER